MYFVESLYKTYISHVISIEIFQTLENLFCLLTLSLAASQLLKKAPTGQPRYKGTMSFETVFSEHCRVAGLAF